MIYFIRDKARQRIKIGTTIRLSERLYQLARETGPDLEVLAVTEGDRTVEQELHRQFAHLRVVGEWFEPGDDLVGFIVSEGRTWDGTDEVPHISAKTIGIRVTAEYADWIERLAKHYRTTVAGVIDRALAEWTETEGYPERPPERTP